MAKKKLNKVLTNRKILLETKKNNENKGKVHYSKIKETYMCYRTAVMEILIIHSQ